MAVASRLAVARVSPDGAAGRRGRPGFAVVGIPAAARQGRRRGGAVAASPPTEEAVQMTEPLTKEDLVAYLVSGCKPKENWRIGTEHEKFGFEVETLRPIKYDQIRDILNGLSERFEWEKIIEENNVIGLKQGKQSISLEPGGQFELSGAPLETLHQTCAEVNSHLYQSVKCKSLLSMNIGSGSWRDQLPCSASPTWRKGETCC